jgi:hypothetical protein
MHNDFDNAAKEILNLSDRAIISFLNANLETSHPPDTRVIRTDTEYRLPFRSGEKTSRGKTIIADKVFLVGEAGRYHIEVQLDRRTGMALRMFRYDAAEALEHPAEEDGIQTVTFPKSLVIYLEPAAGTPDHEILRVRFPDGACYDYRTPVIKLPELSVAELTGRHLVIFMPLYILRLRRKVERAKTRGEREELAAELRKLYRELGEAMKREKEAGNMTEVDGDKVLDITEVLHRKVYGGYNEFEEDRMEFPNLRVIEKLHAELDEERRSREEAAFKVAELERVASRVTELEQAREEERRSREEALSMAGQRLRDTARNILRAGQPIEQVAQWTGLPPETVRALAAQLQ